MRKLKAGIIGLGVGESHIQGYESHPGCEVAVLCDLSEEKLKTAGQKYSGKRLTRDANEVLKDPDIQIVSIASYDNDHYDQIAKAIESGKHIFVEKPVCLNAKELKGIRRLLKANPRVRISSNLILRRTPRFLYLKQAIRDGVFGKLFHMEGDYFYGRIHKITEGWRGKIPFYSVFYGGGIHMVDLLLWLTGDKVTEVAAAGNRIASEGSQFKYNDFTAALLKFKSGMTAKISSNFGCVVPHFHGLEIYGTQASFWNGPEHGTLFESRDPKAAPRKITQIYPGAQKGDLLPDFIDSIVKGKEPEVSAEDVFKVMSVCLAVEKASNESGWVQVEYI